MSKYFKATGRKRYVSKKNMIVLQIEYTDIETSCIGGMVDSETITKWRDATLEDISVFTEPILLSMFKPN